MSLFISDIILDSIEPISALIIFVLIGISLNAQDLNLFENEIFVSESDTLNYIIFLKLLWAK